MFTQTLPKKTAELLRSFAHAEFLHSFYLSGGTALALEMGHRESEDLDFFNQDDFNPLELQQELTPFGKLEEVEIATGTLNLFLNGVKLQFLRYQYPLLEAKLLWEGIQLSSEIDIACTKLITISMRGSKKDFIDLFFLLKDYSLNRLFEAVQEKYRGSDYNQTHILKSLVYFDDAEQQPMPRMHKEVNWDQVKKEIVETVKKFEL